MSGRISPDPTPAVSVAALMRGKLLLVRRGREPARGLHAFPGGKVESGETAEAAAHRELAEETGLRAGRLTPYRTLTIAPAAPGASAYELTVFVASEVTGSLEAGDDADHAGWYGPGEIEGLPLAEGTRSIAAELFGTAGPRRLASAPIGGHEEP